MSRKSFESNPIGFLKKFISRSNSLLIEAEELGFPKLSSDGTLSECSVTELLELSEVREQNLILLQRWLVQLYTTDEDPRVFELIRKVGSLCRQCEQRFI